MVLQFLAAGFAAALLCAALTRLLWPAFERYAIAKPNARSSHKTPVPEGGGIPVIAAALAVTGLALWLSPRAGAAWLLPVGAAAILLSLTGALDDILKLPVLPRLALQFAGVSLAVFTAPAEWRLFEGYAPIIAERTLCVVLGVWFVNLANFMDGIDWITSAEFVPLTLAIAVFGALGKVSPASQLLAAALCVALLGFAPFNKPPAKLFLGDGGSLPIGLLAAALLFDLACHGAIIAAIILPLYYICDATFTLLKRLARREPVWKAHRQHAYQRAVDSLWPVKNVSGAILGLNLALAGLAALALQPGPAWLPWAALAAALALVITLMRRFMRAVPA